MSTPSLPTVAGPLSASLCLRVHTSTRYPLTERRASTSRAVRPADRWIRAKPLVLRAPGDATAQVGTAYSAPLTATGGTAPYAYSIEKGALPDGLTLDAASGAITGTPTTAGTYHLTG